jgi:catechol 2,3-dioxygenase-like lactoylglutathione lyase family enzyme
VTHFEIWIEVGNGVDYMQIMGSRNRPGPTEGFAPLVPELDVFDLAASLHFWCEILGFRIAYDRPENCFAFLERREGAQVMLCQRNGSWETGSLERPLGRGINFYLRVASIEPALAARSAIGWPLFREPHDDWYRVGDHEDGNRQFLVQDSDGYLVRFAQSLGVRPSQISK